MLSNSLNNIRDYIEASIAVKQAMLQDHILSVLLQIASKLSTTLHNNGTIFLFGNGGSAADAQHVVAELVGRFMRERRALPAIALTTNTSILTAIGNDYAFDKIFARQVEAFVSSTDTVIGISTSGNSANVLEGLKIAHKVGANTVGFTGQNGQMLAQATDLCLLAPSDNTAHIQEAHIVAWHIICDLIEETFDESTESASHIS